MLVHKDSRNFAHDPDVHQGSAHLHQSREYRNQVEPAIGNTLIQVNLCYILGYGSLCMCSVLQRLH